MVTIQSLRLTINNCVDTLGLVVNKSIIRKMRGKRVVIRSKRGCSKKKKIVVREYLRSVAQTKKKSI